MSKLIYARNVRDNALVTKKYGKKHYVLKHQLKINFPNENDPLIANGPFLIGYNPVTICKIPPETLLQQPLAPLPTNFGSVQSPRLKFSDDYLDASVVSDNIKVIDSYGNIGVLKHQLRIFIHDKDHVTIDHNIQNGCFLINSDEIYSIPSNTPLRIQI
jgi:hypothetical protein